jgi:hypothetical protein
LAAAKTGALMSLLVAPLLAVLGLALRVKDTDSAPGAPSAALVTTHDSTSEEPAERSRLLKAS